jgi:hypothetical protein
MSKRNKYSKLEDFVEEPKEQIEFIKEVPRLKSENTTVALKLMIDAKVNVTGYVTGNSYVFDGAGSVVNVDERDVESLLNKRQGGRQCCGGTDFGNAVFSMAEVT